MIPNTERLLKLADVIEENPDNFYMGRWIDVSGDPVDLTLEVIRQVDLHACGTTACIAGWAVWLWPAEADDDDGFTVSAAKILGLDYQVASGLFLDVELSADQASDRLRELAR